MISHLTYVCCDQCENPAQPVVGNALEARQAAHFEEGFRRIGGRDICRECQKRYAEWCQSPESS